MKELLGINLERMNNGAHFSFVSNVLTRIEADETVQAKAASQVANLKAAMAKEDEYLKISQKSFKSDDIAKADSDRDKIYICYKGAVRLFLKLPMTEMAEAAKVLNQNLKDYAIDPRMQLDRETGLIVNLIDDLEKKYAAEVTTLGLDPLVTGMKEANEKVREYLLVRDNENSSKIVGALKAARDVTDEAYRMFVRMINSLAVVEGEAAYATFIDGMNTMIVRFKREALGQTASSTTTGGTTTDSDAPVTDEDEEEGGDDSGDRPEVM